MLVRQSLSGTVNSLSVGLSCHRHCDHCHLAIVNTGSICSELCIIRPFLPVLFLLATWHVGSWFLDQGIEPMPPAVEVWSLNHWTMREVLFIYPSGRFIHLPVLFVEIEWGEIAYFVLLQNYMTTFTCFLKIFVHIHKSIKAWFFEFILKMALEGHSMYHCCPIEIECRHKCRSHV